MRDIDSMSRGECLGPKQNLTHNHAQLGLPDNGRAINRLLFCYIVWLGSLKGMSLKTCARWMDLFSCCCQSGFRARVPQHPHRYKHNITCSVPIWEQDLTYSLVDIMNIFPEASFIGKIFKQGRQRVLSCNMYYV